MVDIRYIAFVLLAIVLSFQAGATVIGANKGVVDYKNVLKSGYAQELVTLTTDSEFNISVTYEPSGEIAQWIRLEPSTQPFYISRDAPYTVAIVVEPPQDTQISRYSGGVRFLTGVLAGPEGQFGTAVRTAINVRLGVQVTGQEVVACSMAEWNMEDVEEGYPLEVRGVITNNGNVRIKPEVVMEFYNQDQSKLVDTLRFTLDQSVLPTVQSRFFRSIRHNLTIGQYWVRISTPICGEAGNGFLTVSVIEKGGVSDKGELLDIDNPSWVKVGDIIPIDAVFVNLGSRVVSAKFKGTISSGDEVFKVIDTESLDVLPGQTQRLRTYFNPIQEGQYTITGRVLYNKKLTYERTGILNVNEKGAPPSQGSDLNFTLIVFMIGIVVLLLLIWRRRRK